MEDLQQGRAVSRRYRNRRIGELLKELDLAEGRSTGVPKILRTMRKNGSPLPSFETDETARGFASGCRRTRQFCPGREKPATNKVPNKITN